MGLSGWRWLLAGETLMPAGDPSLTVAPRGLRPASPGWDPPRTMVNVILSISCLSLVLCCRKGLCLGKKGRSPRSENGNGETEAGSMDDPCRPGEEPVSVPPPRRPGTATHPRSSLKSMQPRENQSALLS